jgi:hypothetical protein
MPCVMYIVVLSSARRRYDPERLEEGWNTLPDGEEVYFIGNPALGLWAAEGRLLQS